MEDVHVISLDARTQGECPPPPQENNKPIRVSFFGIWDGHGGVDCARFASETLSGNAIKAGLLTLKVGQLPSVM